MTKDTESEDIDLSKQNDEEGTSNSEDASQDDSVSEDAGESADSGDDSQGSQDDSSSGYQAKLNATNRFLKKEGYVFKDGRWQKPARTSEAAGTGDSQDQQQAPPSLTRDEAKLVAKGYDDEEIEHAKKVAVLEGCSVFEAVSKELFTTWKAGREKKAKEQDAQRGASRGSRSSTKKTFATPGLPDADHREMFREKTGR